MEKSITRRDFMRATAGFAVAAAVSLKIEPKKKTTVVLIRDHDVLDASSKANAKTIQQMLDSAVMVLTGENDPVRAFQRLITPEDIVGIKSNAWFYLPTPFELESAVERRVLDAGVKKENISIDDRGVLENPVFQRATAIINVRPLRTHYWSGIGGCIKNLIMFAPSPSKYHPDSCADLALVWKLPEVKDKIRLNILSALTPQFHGRGPHHYDRRYVWNYKGIIAGQDPVAVDAVGLEIIKAKRKEYFGHEIKFETIPKHIRTADIKHGLGTSNLDQIELIKLGWTKDSLI
uniref:DUF362 domain-containing protein n=1 Tax=Candidatus Desulfatibia profunda TaxID=2841695 RepID=A0A8J6TMU2_9BACT|nr:DUF362 domain-containing protein [Candidatus Desulfatibia profunda]